MSNHDAGLLVASLFLILFSAFFVGAEYALVGSRRSKIEALARGGSTRAATVLKELDQLPRHVAGIQIGITMLGIGVGTITEPFVGSVLTRLIGPAVGSKIAFLLSFLFVSFLLVVLGELVPKYGVLRSPERVAVVLIRPLVLLTYLFLPLIYIAQFATKIVLQLFGIRSEVGKKETVAKDELLLLVKSGETDGILDPRQAEIVSRALRIDNLDARDVMIHRLDIDWIDATQPTAQVIAKVKRIPHSRIPVCTKDLDELIGIVYLHDVMKNWDRPDFDIAQIAYPPILVPENLSLDRILARMREERIQIVIVVDEYGGTSGLVTLEDIVEELFGELEDRLESQRPTIERFPGGRLSARAEVRVDELEGFLGLAPGTLPGTESLATLVMESLERVPRPGDTVKLDWAVLRVENMARRRVTRVGVRLIESIESRVALDYSHRED